MLLRKLLRKTWQILLHHPEAEQVALTQIIRQICPTCNKVALESSRLKLGKTIIIKLACGHILHSETLTSTKEQYDSIAFSDGYKPWNYQIEGIQFAEESNIRCIIADEQGLGKTIEAACLLRLHPDKLLPAVIVCPSSVKMQWMFELHRICDVDAKNKQFLTQVIQSGKELAMPGFQVYIITYDMLKKDDLFKLLPEGTIKTLIIDECHRIKNHLSERAKAVQRLARNTPHILPMSGTPIKNNAGEYFTVLNLVAPTRFPHYQQYVDAYCDAYSNGWSQKIGGLKNVERFHNDTKDIIIRRTKDEVLKDLPAKNRKFYHIELDRKLNKAYAAAMKELDDMMYSDESEFEKTTSMIAIMGKLRHITGISKVSGCVDFVTEFLLSTDRKIVVFTHHQDVMDMLEIQLNQWCAEGGFTKVDCLRASLDSNKRADVVKHFKESDCRVMLSIFTEGLNLQFCSDAVLLERQWNPANEENYAEDRFHRFGQVNSVDITYMIASETIDEYFTKIVEEKRAIVAATLDGKVIEWNQQSLMRELAEVLLTKGKKGWSL